MNWQLSNLLRVIAIAVVISIHASNTWWFGVHGVSPTTTMNGEIFIDTFVNQVGRFTVPLFVILSGFGLAQSEVTKPFHLVQFAQRRAIRILPPYLLFTVANLAFRAQFQAAPWLEKLEQFFAALQDGSGDYHLYFLVIIIQCYCLYPLLRRFPFSPSNLAALLIFTFSLFTLRWTISLFGWFAPLAAYVPDSNHCIYWLPYFLLGIWLVKGRDWFAQLVQRLSGWQWGGIWAIAAALELTEFYFAVFRIGSAPDVGHYGRPTVVLLTLAFLLWAMAWRGWENRIPDHWLAVASQASFTTYLIHTQVLRVIFPLEILGGIVYLIVAAIASWSVGIYTHKLLGYCQARFILK